jgi:hypothetical protein
MTMAKNDKNSQQDVSDMGMSSAAVISAAAPPVSRVSAGKVRAKMRVERIEPVIGGGAYIHLRPVTSGSAENNAFYQNTPGGACSIGLVTPEVARLFVLNSDYFVDFTPA